MYAISTHLLTTVKRDMHVYILQINCLTLTPTLCSARRERHGALGHRFRWRHCAVRGVSVMARSVVASVGVNVNARRYDKRRAALARLCVMPGASFLRLHTHVMIFNALE
jgi:hypothetical protein